MMVVCCTVAQLHLLVSCPFGVMTMDVRRQVTPFGVMEVHTCRTVAKRSMHVAKLNLFGVLTMDACRKVAPL